MLCAVMHEEQPAADDIAATDPRKLARLLLYGRAETRRRLAEQVVQAWDAQTLRLVVETATGAGDWQLRGRCLEVLGLIAGAGNQRTCEWVLDALLGAPRSADATTRPGHVALTQREREIAGWICLGWTNAEIATRLGLSERTVESHVSRSLAKLGLTSRTQLAMRLAPASTSQPLHYCPVEPASAD